MANLDPPENFLDQYLEGERFVNDNGTLTPAAIHFFEQLNRFNTDTFEKLGGTDDAIEDADIKELYSWQGLRKPEQDPEFSHLFGATLVRQLISNLGFTVIELSASDTAHTTTGRELVICNNINKAVITLNPNAEQQEEVIIVRNGIGGVDVTAVKKISGQTIKTILRRYSAPHHIFTQQANSWSVI